MSYIDMYNNNMNLKECFKFKNIKSWCKRPVSIVIISLLIAIIVALIIWNPTPFCLI